jgi:hypothetical protein
MYSVFLAILDGRAFTVRSRVSELDGLYEYVTAQYNDKLSVHSQ